MVLHRVVLAVAAVEAVLRGLPAPPAPGLAAPVGVEQRAGEDVGPRRRLALALARQLRGELSAAPRPRRLLLAVEAVAGGARDSVAVLPRPAGAGPQAAPAPPAFITKL